MTEETFEEALTTSLIRYGVFAKVIQNRDTDYSLEVKILHLKAPFFGASMTITPQVSWALTNNRTGRVVWRQITDRPYTAAFSDAVIGENRWALALEGAIRENIKVGVEQMDNEETLEEHWVFLG